MPYRYRNDLPDYTDFASGRVFYSLPGVPAFPVRLVGEIFQRCGALLSSNGQARPYKVYDPCCGSAYMLGTLSYLHWPEISWVIASDIDGRALEIARKNLSLLTLTGIDKRIEELEGMLASYGKESHLLALESAKVLRLRLAKMSSIHSMETVLFQADITDAKSICAALGEVKADLVLTDIPYGLISSWQSSGSSHAPAINPATEMLEALRYAIQPGGLVAIASSKGQKIAHEAYQRLEHFRLGKRQVVILKSTTTG